MVGRSLVALALAVCFIPATVWSAIGPFGPEFQVNATTYGSQGGFHGASVAADAAGNFIVVWQADNYGSAIGRRFGFDGTPKGGEFRVSRSSQYCYYGYCYSYGAEALNPEVAADAAGHFVVVWSTYDCAGTQPYTGTEGICGHRFRRDGTPRSPEFLVSTQPDEINVNPKVASDAIGNFVVVWSDYYGVVGRRFLSNGNPLDEAEFQVSLHTTGSVGYSFIVEDRDGIEIAAEGDGDFMVVWSLATYDDVFIIGRAFDSAGSPRGDDFQVSSNAPAYYPNMGITVDGTGRFTVVWNQDYEIRGRQFDQMGTALGPEFQVSADTTTFKFIPKVAADAAGGFVVVWTDYEREYPGSYGGGIFGRQFDSSAMPVGSDFQVNTYSDYPQKVAEIASGAGGNFVVTWQSYYQDGYGEGIFAQRFAEPGASIACAPAPKEDCRGSILPRRSKLRIRDKDLDSKDQVKWGLSRGEETSLADLGDPTTITSYVFCIYDASTAEQPLLQARMPTNAPTGGDCPGRPCWTGSGNRIEYRDKGLDPDGVKQTKLRAADEGRVVMKLKAVGENLDMPQLPLTPPVVAQLQASNDECWGARYETFVNKNQSNLFGAKAD